MLMRYSSHRLPPISGQPVRLEIRRALMDRRGAVHAGAFVRERRIAFDASLAGDPREFARIFVHEVFHFAWLRLGNARRWYYEELLRGELLGTSAITSSSRLNTSIRRASRSLSLATD